MEGAREGGRKGGSSVGGGGELTKGEEEEEGEDGKLKGRLVLVCNSRINKKKKKLYKGIQPGLSLGSPGLVHSVLGGVT